MISGFISIILPVYNQKDTLQESIDSVIAQTFTNWELLILNDGSTEDLDEVINLYDDDRIKYHKLQHQGLPKTLNHGLKIAKGEFITWTSGDNIMLPNMLEELFATIKQNSKTTAVYSGYYVISDDGNIVGKNLKNAYCYHPMRFLKSKDREFLIAQHCNFGPSFLMRSSACKKAGGYDALCEGIEDVDYSLRIAMIGPVQWLPKYLYKYRVHDNSMTGREVNGETSYSKGRQYFWNKVKKNLYKR